MKCDYCHYIIDDVEQMLICDCCGQEICESCDMSDEDGQVLCKKCLI